MRTEQFLLLIEELMTSDGPSSANDIIGMLVPPRLFPLVLTTNRLPGKQGNDTEDSQHKNEY